MNEDAQKAMLAAAGRYIRKMLAPVEDRLKSLESITIEKGDPGKDGADGKDGRDGIDGLSPDAESVADSVAAKFERRFADLSLSWERQSRDMAEKAIDRMPAAKDGEAGKDGRDFGAFEFEYDGARSLTIRYKKDGETVEQIHRMPVVIDAGFFQEGTEYEKGDGTTFGGSYWIAQADTSSKPEIGSKEWRLAVRKGRDAKARGASL